MIQYFLILIFSTVTLHAADVKQSSAVVPDSKAVMKLSVAGAAPKVTQPDPLKTLTDKRCAMMHWHLSQVDAELANCLHGAPPELIRVIQRHPILDENLLTGYYKLKQDDSSAASSSAAKLVTKVESITQTQILSEVLWTVYSQLHHSKKAFRADPEASQEISDTCHTILKLISQKDT